jgi:hypothetical protein
MRIFPAVVLGCSLVAPTAVAAETSCYPHCDYVHDYSPRDLTYVQPGLFCYPRCFADGSCAPYSPCVLSGSRGRVLVRSLAGAATMTPTTVTYYDPSLATVRVSAKRTPARKRR